MRPILSLRSSFFLSLGQIDPDGTEEGHALDLRTKRDTMYAVVSIKEWK
jgi:hypothetical protein